MRMFQYECPEHGKFEKLLKEKKDTQPCPECGKDSKKIIGSPSVHYNSLGFNGLRNYGGDS